MDSKKLLDQQGLSTLISLIKQQLSEEETKLAENYYTKSEMSALLNQKQGKLIAGKDMQITSNNVINNKHIFFEQSDIDEMWNAALDLI